MRLFVIRHGKAEKDSPSGGDSDRALTPLGRSQARWLGEHLAPTPPSLVLYSPILRARRTAELILESLNTPSRPEPRLATGRAPSDVLEAVREASIHDALAIVGHNPHFEDLVALLLRGPGSTFELRTGQLVTLDVDPAGPLGTARLIEQARLDSE